MSTSRTTSLVGTRVLSEAFESLCEEADPLGLEVFTTKTYVQAFVNNSNATIVSILVSDEDVEFTQMFKSLESLIHSSSACEPEVNRRLQPGWSAVNSLDERIWFCRHMYEWTKADLFARWSFRKLFLQTWTVTRELKQRLNSFGTISSRFVLRYGDRTRQNVLLDRLSGLRQMQKRKMRLYGHVVRLLRRTPPTGSCTVGILGGGLFRWSTRVICVSVKWIFM